MTATPCAIDGRPTPDGWICAECADRAAGHLAEIIALTPDARLVAAGLVRRGGGGGGGKPGSRPPLNVGATDVLDAVQVALTTLARDIAETRGVPLGPDGPRARLRSPQSAQHRLPGRRDTPRASEAISGDPLIEAARFLQSQLEWLRHATDEQGGAYAVAVFAEIDLGARRLRSLVNGPAERRYLGPCGAILAHDRCPASTTGMCLSMTEGFARCDSGECIHWEESVCDGDIYAPRGGSVGRCRACGATVAAADREAWLDGEVRAHAFRAAQIASAYGVNVNTIRSWALRGSLKSYFRTEGGIVAAWTDPADGETRERLHYVGEVLDLAAADAARRETERAKRERRTAAKAADERMSA